MTRRSMLGYLTAVGAAGTVVATTATGASPLAGAATEPHRWTDSEQRERERVLAVGFTDDEADCWLLVARAAGAFLDLEELHPSDRPEAAVAFHVIQGKLMQRPAYRPYREQQQMRADERSPG